MDRIMRKIPTHERKAVLWHFHSVAILPILSNWTAATLLVAVPNSGKYSTDCYEESSGAISTARQVGLELHSTSSADSHTTFGLVHRWAQNAVTEQADAVCRVCRYKNTSVTTILQYVIQLFRNSDAAAQTHDGSVRYGFTEGLVEFNIIFASTTLHVNFQESR